MIDEIVRYICESYTDSSLSLSSVADKFGLSKAYLWYIYGRHSHNFHFIGVPMCQYALPTLLNCTNHLTLDLHYLNLLI